MINKINKREFGLILWVILLISLVLNLLFLIYLMNNYQQLIILIPFFGGIAGACISFILGYLFLEKSINRKISIQNEITKKKTAQDFIFELTYIKNRLDFISKLIFEVITKTEHNTGKKIDYLNKIFSSEKQAFLDSSWMLRRNMGEFSKEEFFIFRNEHQDLYLFPPEVEEKIMKLYYRLNELSGRSTFDPSDGKEENPSEIYTSLAKTHIIIFFKVNEEIANDIDSTIEILKKYI